jgi:hypothetical protein
MPLFADERSLTASESAADDFRHIFRPAAVTETQLSIERLAFSVVPCRRPRTATLPGYALPSLIYIARQLVSSLLGPSLDRWWALNPSARGDDRRWVWRGVPDRLTGVVGGVFLLSPLNEDIFGEPSRVDINLGNMDVLARADEDDEEDIDYPDEPQSNESPPDNRGPVTMTIDLDEQEIAEREGLTGWEMHSGLQGDFHVLIAEKGMAVLHQLPYEDSRQVQGIIRYHDKTSVMIKALNSQDARALAEKYLAKKPYQNAFEKIMEGASYDEPDPPAPEPPKVTPRVAATRPKIERRVWNSVPIDSGDDDA